MSPTATYQIVVKGQPSDRLLRPFLDELHITAGDDDTTVLIGPTRDSSHLNGLLTHLASVRVDLISLTPRPDSPGQEIED